MPEQKSDAEVTSVEETVLERNDVFADDQPMTYEDVDQDDDPTQGDMSVITSFDKKPDDTLSDQVKAYRELQSKSDKDTEAIRVMKEEKEAYQAQLEDFQTYQPIIRYLEQNPYVIDQLASMGKEPTPQNAPTPVVEKLEAPQRPSGYDKFAAYSDPDSESFKYREANDEYRLARIEQAEANIDKKTIEYEERLTQRQQQQNQSLAEQKLNQVLARDYKMSEQERNDFIAFSNNPNPTIDNLVSVFRSVNPKKAGEQEVVPPSKEFRSIVGIPGSSDSAIDERGPDQSFTAGLRTRQKDLFA